MPFLKKNILENLLMLKNNCIFAPKILTDRTKKNEWNETLDIISFVMDAIAFGFVCTDETVVFAASEHAEGKDI